MDILPHLSQDDAGGQRNLEMALERWPKNHLKPHIVADSAFGGMKIMKRIRDWGGTATIAFNPSYQKKTITSLTTHNLAPRSYRTVAKDGIVLSTNSMVSDRGSMAFKHILCVGAKYEVKNLQTPLEISLNSTSLRRAELEKMQIEELDKLATDLKLPVKREKKELKIDRILTCYEETCNGVVELSPVAAYFNKSFSKGTQPIFNDFYKKQFNTVDSVSKFWYKVNETHGNWNWRNKKIFAIFRLVIINLYFSVENTTSLSFVQWREKLAQSILDNIKN